MFWMCLHLLSCFATRSPSLECAALYLFWRALTHWSRSPKVAIHLYACNMVATIKMSQGQLVSLYRDKTTCYSSDEFQSFKNLFDCFHEVGFRSERSQAWALIRGEGSYFMGLPWSYAVGHLSVVDRPKWLHSVAHVQSECLCELTLLCGCAQVSWFLWVTKVYMCGCYLVRFSCSLISTLILVTVIQSACLLIS